MISPSSTLYPGATIWPSFDGTLVIGESRRVPVESFTTATIDQQPETTIYLTLRGIPVLVAIPASLRTAQVTLITRDLAVAQEVLNLLGSEKIEIPPLPGHWRAHAQMQANAVTIDGRAAFWEVRAELVEQAGELWV